MNTPLNKLGWGCITIVVLFSLFAGFSRGDTVECTNYLLSSLSNATATTTTGVNSTSNAAIDVLSKVLYPQNSAYAKVVYVYINWDDCHLPGQHNRRCNTNWVAGTRRIFLDLTPTFISVLSLYVLNIPVPDVYLNMTYGVCRNLTKDETNLAVADFFAKLGPAMYAKSGSQAFVMYFDSACEYKEITSEDWDYCFDIATGQAFPSYPGYAETTQIILWLTFGFMLVTIVWSFVRRSQLIAYVSAALQKDVVVHESSYLSRMLYAGTDSMGCGFAVSSAKLQYLFQVVSMPIIPVGLILGIAIHFALDRDGLFWEPMLNNSVPGILIAFSGSAALVWFYASAIVHDWDITTKLFNADSSPQFNCNNGRQKVKTTTPTDDNVNNIAMYSKRRGCNLTFGVGTQEQFVWWASYWLQFVSTAVYGFCVPWVVLALFLDPDSSFPTLSLYITNIINLYGAIQNALANKDFQWSIKTNLANDWLSMFNNNFIWMIRGAVKPELNLISKLNSLKFNGLNFEKLIGYIPPFRLDWLPDLNLPNHISIHLHDLITLPNLPKLSLDAMNLAGIEMPTMDGLHLSIPQLDLFYKFWDLKGLDIKIPRADFLCTLPDLMDFFKENPFKIPNLDATHLLSLGFKWSEITNIFPNMDIVYWPLPDFLRNYKITFESLKFLGIDLNFVFHTHLLDSEIMLPSLNLGHLLKLNLPQFNITIKSLPEIMHLELILNYLEHLLKLDFTVQFNLSDLLPIGFSISLADLLDLSKNSTIPLQFRLKLPKFSLDQITLLLEKLNLDLDLWDKLHGDIRFLYGVPLDLFGEFGLKLGDIHLDLSFFELFNDIFGDLKLSSYSLWFLSSKKKSAVQSLFWIKFLEFWQKISWEELKLGDFSAKFDLSKWKIDFEDLIKFGAPSMSIVQMLSLNLQLPIIKWPRLKVLLERLSLDVNFPDVFKNLLKNHIANFDQSTLARIHYLRNLEGFKLPQIDFNSLMSLLKLPEFNFNISLLQIIGVTLPSLPLFRLKHIRDVIDHTYIWGWLNETEFTLKDFFDMGFKFDFPIEFSYKMNTDILKTLKLEGLSINLMQLHSWNVDLSLISVDLLINFIKIHPSLGSLPELPDINLRWLGHFLTSLEDVSFIPAFADMDWSWNLQLPSLEDALERIDFAINDPKLQFLVYKRLQLFIKLPKWGVDEFHLRDLMDSVHRSILFQFKSFELKAPKTKLSCNKCSHPSFPKYDFNWEVDMQSSKQKFEKKFAGLISGLVQNTGFARTWSSLRFLLEILLLVLLQLIVYFGLKNYTGNSNLMTLYQTVGYGIAGVVSRATVAWSNRGSQNLTGVLDSITKNAKNQALVSKLKMAVDKLNSTVSVINENKGKVLPYLEKIGVTVVELGPNTDTKAEPGGSSSGVGKDEKQEDGEEPNCNLGFFSFNCPCFGRRAPPEGDAREMTNLVTGNVEVSADNNQN